MNEDAFYPQPISSGVSVKFDNDLMQALADAGTALGRLEGISDYTTQIQGVLYNLALRDGLDTFEGEERHLGLLDILEMRMEAPEETDLVVDLIQNYAGAIVNRLPEDADRSFSPEWLLKIHRKCYQDIIEFTGVLRKEKQPSTSPVKFRGSQKYVAPTGERLQSLVDDYCVFTQDNQRYPALIKAGILEAQWISIQPFGDGNMLMKSLVMHRYFRNNLGILAPLCLLQRVWNKRRIEYTFRIQSLLLEDDWNEWLVFFLRGVEEAAQWSAEVLSSAERLYREHHKMLKDFPGNRKLAQSLVDYLHSQPLVNIQHAAEYLGVVFVTANTLIQQLENINILSEITGQRRNKRYLFQDYYDLFSE